MLQKVLVTALFTIYSFTISAQTEWERTKEKNGIKVYTAREKSSKFKLVKVEAVLEGSIQRLKNILLDVSGTKNWVYGTKDAYLIKKISGSGLIYYSKTSLPWPISDRDAVIKMTLILQNNQTLDVSQSGLSDQVAVKHGVIRVPYFYATWNVRDDDKGRINISYLLKMDPGGSLPAAITNMFVSKGPWETFNNLAELLKK